MRAVAAAPLLLLLAPLLGGCVDAPTYVQEICLEHGYRLQWRQADLREPLLEAAERDGLSITSLRPERGAGFVDPALGLGPGESDVGFAVWRPAGGDPTRLTIVLGAMTHKGPDTWGLEADNLPPGAEGAETLRSFLSWVGLATNPQAEKWIREFLDQLEHEPGRRSGMVEIEAQPDFHGFVQMLRAEGEPEVEHQGIGTLAIHAKSHTLLVHLDVREVVIPVDGARLRVQVDSLGLVSATTTAAEPDKAHVTLVERTERVFTHLGLPKPTWQDAMGAGVNC